MKRIRLSIIVYSIVLYLSLSFSAYSLDDKYKDWLKNGFPAKPEQDEVEFFIYELTSSDQINSEEQIREWLIEFWGKDDPHVNNRSTLELLHKTFEVVKFWVEDINEDGKVELIAQLDRSGNGWPQDLIIVYEEKENFKFQMIEARNSDVIDLGKKGKVIVAYKTISAYRGRAYPWAYWPQTYRWNGAGVAIANDTSMYYNNTVIPEAEKEISKIKSQNDLSSKTKEELISLERMKIYKSKRFAKIDPKAGFKEAQEWFKSENKKLRENALYIFFDIADEESIKFIQKALTDEDPDVAREAKSAYEYLKAKKVKE